MNAQQDDAKRLRVQNEALIHGFSQTGQNPSSGMPCLVAQTTKLVTYPSSAQQFFACTPLSILGLEIEGGAGILTLANSTIFALNLGLAIPPLNVNILVTFVDNRWVFRYDG